MLIKDFIPVDAKENGKDTIWYMDVSMLSLNQLVNLKNELKGNKIESIVQLDAIIHDMINLDRQDLKAERREKQRNKDSYRNPKALIKNRHRGRR